MADRRTRPLDVDVRLRRADPADAAGITRAHIASWKTTYAGFLPPEVVAQRTRWDERLAAWEQRLNDDRSTFVVEDDGGIFGFACAGQMPQHPQDRDPFPGYDAYLRSLYLTAGRQRQGLGRALLAAVAEDLVARGHRRMALHVLGDNPARGFYERLGAVHLRDEPRISGQTWTTSLYGFEEIGLLAPSAG